MGGVGGGRGKRQSGERDTLILLWHDRLHHALRTEVCVHRHTNTYSLCMDITLGYLLFGWHSEQLTKTYNKRVGFITSFARKTWQATCRFCFVTVHQPFYSSIVYPCNHSNSTLFLHTLTVIIRRQEVSPQLLLYQHKRGKLPHKNEHSG